MDNPLFWLALFLLIVIGSILLRQYLGRIFQPDPLAEKNLPYLKREYLLTMAERIFYDALKQVAEPDMQIFVKVRLIDLLSVPDDIPNRTFYVNRVLAKHIDFVLSNYQKITPLLVIELDDSSHNLDHRRQRGDFVDAALRKAGIPLLRVRVRRTYDVTELAQDIYDALHSNPTPSRARR